MELTREQFMKEIAELNERETTFNVESADTGSIYMSFYGCNIDVRLEDGIEGEIIMFKPYTQMEATIDFDIVDVITKGDDLFLIEMSRGLPDIVISVSK